MDKNLTEIVMLIDASGSMHGLTNDTIGNVKKFIEEQKAVPGNVYVTIATFSYDLMYIFNHVDIENIVLSNNWYRTAGGTALIDASCNLIDKVGQRLATTPESYRPSKVIFVTITDGEENSSREFTNEDLKSRITTQTDVYKWSFVYLGANQDAFKVANKMGYSADTVSSYNATPLGLGQVYGTVSANIAKTRQAVAKGQSTDVIFTADDKTKLENTK
jgi:uncharacterized protein YegL